LSDEEEFTETVGWEEKNPSRCATHLGLERNLISVSKMSDAGVHTLFHKDSCKMVRGAMVLMKGVQIGTLYKLLGNVDLTG
jgi:hypothetical protein